MPQGHQRALEICRKIKKENCNKEDKKSNPAKWYRANRPKRSHPDITKERAQNRNNKYF